MERMVSIKEAVFLTSLGRTEQHRRSQAGTFPRKVSLGGKGPRARKAYPLSELEKWMRNPLRYRQPPLVDGIAD